MSDQPTPNVTGDTFLEHLAKVAGYRRDLDEANGVYRASLKAAKAAGIDTKMLVKVMNDRKADPDQLAIEARNYARYAKWAGLPIGTQLSLLGDDVPAPTPEAQVKMQVDDAYDAGIVAGRAGRPQEGNTQEPGTEQWAAWDQGWLHGQGMIAKEMEISGDEPKQPKAPKAPTAKKGRQQRGASQAGNAKSVGGEQVH